MTVYTAYTRLGTLATMQSFRLGLVHLLAVVFAMAVGSLGAPVGGVDNEAPGRLIV